MGVIIIGHGNYLPSLKFDNKLLIETFGINSSDEWIKNNLGIEKRSWAPSGVNTSDIAYYVAKEAMENAGIEANQINKIILGTSTADHTNLSSACKVQYLLGSKAASFDIVSACASFIFALHTSIDSVMIGDKYVLALGADVKSRFVNKDDRKFLPIFGDGGGGFILTKGEEGEGFIGRKLWTDGSIYDDMYNPAGGSAMPASEDTVKNKLHATKMKVDGHFVTLKAAEIMATLAEEVCQESGIEMDDIDYVIPHHANSTIMNHFLNKASIPKNKLFSTISYTGNLVSGSIAFALSALLKSKIKPGSLVLIVSVGAGASGGAMVYKVPNI